MHSRNNFWRFDVVFVVFIFIAHVQKWQCASFLLQSGEPEFIFQQDIAVSHAGFLTISRKRLRCDGIFNDLFLANLLLGVLVKEFCKLVNI